MSEAIHGVFFKVIRWRRGFRGRPDLKKRSMDTRLTRLGFAIWALPINQNVKAAKSLASLFAPSKEACMAVKIVEKGVGLFRNYFALNLSDPGVLGFEAGLWERSYFFSPHDLDLQLPLQVFAVFLVLFALLLGRPHLLLEDVEDVGALNVGRHFESSVDVNKRVLKVGWTKMKRWFHSRHN